MADVGGVVLVGAGPGDPGLLTLAGRTALEQAEVVLYDRLVSSGVLALISPRALRIDVGKTKGNHPVPQERINELILEHARNGKRVVRLKGGDPYLFGRGAEELELLVENGIPFRVIPGVTSAIAAPSYGGIPVTHREYASSLHILTGHGKDGDAPALPFAELARLGGTLVFLMGLGALQHICRGLLEAGMAPGTPAAVIENGTLPRQRRVAATLERMPDEAARHAVSSPAILVVGAVCGLAERFDWTGFLPLWGREILVVSSQATGRGLAERLREKGCGVDEMCGIEMEALPQPEGFWRGLPAYDWIVMTSDFGARLFAEGLLQNDVDVRAFSKTRFAVVGSRTAAALRRIGIIADYVPMSFTARCLAEGLAPLITRGDRVLQYRAREGSGDVAAMLREKGADYEEVAAYATRRRDVADDAVRRRLAASAYAAVTFTSGSAVDAFAAGMDGLDFSRMRAVCIGEVTAAAAAKLGLRTETSPEATLDSMTAYIVEKIGK